MQLMAVETKPYKNELHNKLQTGYLETQRDNGRFYLFVSRSGALHASYRRVASWC